MNIEAWNRKDCTPDATVEKIKKILAENKIDTHVVDMKQYGDFWASARVEFDLFGGLGANGKGVNVPYTLASAYGELIERIQGKALVHSLFYAKESNSINECPQSIRKCISLLRQYFAEETRMYSDTQIYELLNAYPHMQELTSFYDVKKRNTVEVPSRFLGFICGTNGLAAGNTYEEAFCQGLCEVFERYVMREIYFGNREWPVIPRRSYSRTNSMKLIEQIENKGFSCKVINCTINGLLPVVGVLVLDPSNTKYLFRLGSDINFDLALQRCITEVFQGVNFDVTFRMQMQSIFQEECEIASIWNYRNPAKGIARSITDGTGIIPYKLLNGREEENLNPFDFIQDSNVYAMQKLILIFTKLGKNLYIKDCSFLGFPTVQIFVPEVSNAYFYPNNMDYLSVLKAIGQLPRAMTDQRKNPKATQSLLEKMLAIRCYQTFEHNTMLNKFTGIYFKCNAEYPQDLQDIDFVIGMLALSIHDYETARAYLRSSYKLESYINNNFKYVDLILNAFENCISREEIMSTLKSLNVHERVLTMAHQFICVNERGYSIHACGDCTNCEFSESCSIEQWRELCLNLQSKERMFDLTNPYKKHFFTSLSEMLSNESFIH